MLDGVADEDLDPGTSQVHPQTAQELDHVPLVDSVVQEQASEKPSTHPEGHTRVLMAAGEASGCRNEPMVAVVMMGGG